MVASIAAVTALVTTAGAVHADEPATTAPPAVQSDEAVIVEVGLPPVPTETIPDAAPPAEAATAEPPSAPTTTVQVAVGPPPVPTDVVPDAVPQTLSLW